ncbi:LPXTG cell wall anchor domain-containing protein [Enterococcus canintestini]|uniref:LPXTG cell wall anchor domain-containing protein n=1 Tax=Enterococcus TaxID=1350 RepID=UPI0009000951|nr:LPXTG cell wall anchor domain-containing protein [Enterococcus canintestini]
MSGDIQVTGVLNMPVESSVSEPGETTSSSTSNEVVYVSTKKEFYPQTGDEINTNYLIMGVLMIILSITLIVSRFRKKTTK